MANNGGWIKLHRKITDWCWYKDANTFRVFMHLLLNANASNEPIFARGGVKVERGQVCTTHREIMEALDLTERQTRTALLHLISTDSITVRRTANSSIISILSFDEYNPKRQTNNERSDKRSDNPSNKQEIKKGKEEYINSSFPQEEGAKRNGKSRSFAPSEKKKSNSNSGINWI